MSYITRHKLKGKFVYKNNTPDDLERIKKLVIPPMWTNVKIDKNKDSKVQATGYDTKGRKQYIYHKDFIEKSKSMKFNKLKTFDYNKYSKVIKHYMNKCDLSKECVIANVIKLMEDLNIRVGNESYKKENGSYGITTLLKKHHKNNVLTFIGKKGVAHIKYITDPRSISFIKRVMTMRGPNLFYYEPDKSITSSDLNTFLREKVQSNITCKDIRTYCANKIFVNFMNKLKKPDTEKDRKSNVIKGIDYTANELGNTRKICKDSYLCPKNINKFLN
jgi:DNA topoisomerase-1